MKKPVKVIQVGVSALAREVGLSATAVSQKLKQGQTPEQIRQAAARKQGLPPAERGGGRRPTGQKKEEYELVVEARQRMELFDDAKLRRARALAERGELDNMLRRGELVPVAYVRQWGTRFLTDARDTLMTGPSELADTLAAETDPLKVNAILRTWLERVMGKFHQLDKLWGVGDQQEVA